MLFFLSSFYICSFPMVLWSQLPLAFCEGAGSFHKLAKEMGFLSEPHLSPPLPFPLRSQAFANTLKEELWFIALGFALRNRRSGIKPISHRFTLLHWYLVGGIGHFCSPFKKASPLSSFKKAWDLKFYLYNESRVVFQAPTC